jgi:hypothetical protein
MGENIVGLFNTEAEAHAAAQAFRAAGFGEGQISVIAKQTPAAISAVAQRADQADMEIDDDSAVGVQPGQLVQAAEPGGVYVIVRAHSDNEAQRAIDLMHQSNVAAIEHRDQAYHEGAWQPLDETTESGAARSRTV